jgi:hypothetical protein
MARRSRRSLLINNGQASNAASHALPAAKVSDNLFESRYKSHRAVSSAQPPVPHGLKVPPAAIASRHSKPQPAP